MNFNFNDPIALPTPVPIPNTFTIPLTPLTNIVGLCPIADKFNQFDIAKLLASIITKDVKELTPEAAKFRFDHYDGSNDVAFRYGILNGNKCERREWLGEGVTGNGDSQFDLLKPTDEGFEFNRDFDTIKSFLHLDCTVDTVDKVKLYCKTNTFFDGYGINYEVTENEIETREKLCFYDGLDDGIDECEELLTPKNKTPVLLNKLLHFTNKT